MTHCSPEIITHRKVTNNSTLRLIVKGCGLKWLWICIKHHNISHVLCGCRNYGGSFFVWRIWKIFSVSAPTHASPHSFHFQSKNVKVINLRLEPAHTHTHTLFTSKGFGWMTPEWRIWEQTLRKLVTALMLKLFRLKRDGGRGMFAGASTDFVVS